MKPSWDNITVQQFQDIHRLSLNAGMEDMTRIERAIAILFNMTESEVGNLTIQEFNKYASQCSFLFTEQVPGKCVKYIKSGRKKYGIQYNPKKLRHRQYVEILTFSAKPIENMHLIMASLAQPIRYGLIWGKNTVDNHESVASDMLNARLIDVYHSCVFFCKLYNNLIEDIKASLVRMMMKKGATKKQIQDLFRTSKIDMDGFTAQKKPPFTTESH